MMILHSYITKVKYDHKRLKSVSIKCILNSKVQGKREITYTMKKMSSVSLCKGDYTFSYKRVDFVFKSYFTIALLKLK